jgi:Lamin Tail Domain/CotH kinase protein
MLKFIAVLLRSQVTNVCLGALILMVGEFAQAQYSADRELAGPSSRKTGLVITEIMYNPKPLPGQSTNVTLEFIEVFNSKPWAEDISGFSIDGMVRFVFPANSMLQPGGYLVVARYPGLVQTNYSITNVVGPWIGATTNRLSTERGQVQLRNRQGAVLLVINYQDSPPWPEGADGTGHSLVLARPSYGEDDFRAWSQSDVVGGSPGGPDPQGPELLASLVINEWQNHSDPVDWIELYNHSNIPVDLSGAWLSDDPATNKYRIQNGTTIPARGFLTWDQNQLGFELFAGGETIFLWNSNQTRLIDVIDFRGASNNVSQGRWPDGGPFIYGMSANSASRGLPNPRPLRYGVVINEIMFNPISGSSDDEYVELYNRGSQPVNLTEWEFVTGISYLFPTNASIAPGGYVVVARNPTNLFAIYTNLNSNNTYGPYSGTLANGGERISLAAADYDVVDGTNERLAVVVSDLVYGDGGKWGFWSDGQGSSLELIDPDADVRHPSNWADSSDVSESLWTAIEATVPLGESLGTPINDSLIVMLQGIGECLIDELEVRVDGGPNLVANGGFESGLSAWSLQGSHDFSTIENEGFVGTKSLHIRAGSRGDNQSNRLLSSPFANPIPPGAVSVSLRAKVKWLRGHPEILLRLHGSATEAYGRLALPRRLGSPGQANSRRIPNAGPAVYSVAHSPLLPAASQPVVITARATDANNPITVTLRYRVDPTPTYTGVTMRDDGTAGDAIAADGIFSATIPGQDDGAMVAFYVEGRDSQNFIGTFPQYVFPPAGLTRCWPNDALARECIVRWGEVQMPGDFGTYHLWVSAVNSNRWHTRDTQNNTSMDGTFIYNNSRVIYNAEPLYSGSPWHRTNATTGPAGTNRVDYEMNFPDDDALLGSTDFVLNNPGNPDILTISDLSAVAEQTVYKIFEGLGAVHNHRRYIHLFVNGSQRSKAYERAGNFIFEDSQQPNGDMIGQWFPNDAGGQLFKVEDWFEFSTNGFDITANNDADLARRTILIDGQPTQVPAPYRFMFRKRSVNIGSSANDFSPIYALIDAASPPENPTNTVIDPDVFGAVADWEAWMRHFAVQRAVGNWDSYGWERGKNDYLYRTTAGFVHMPWDIDYSLGLGRGPNEPLFASNDPRITAMFNTPAIVRAYWRAFADLVAGPFSNATLDPFIDARVATLTSNSIDIDVAAVASIKNYINDRRAFLLSQLATVNVSFALDGPMDFNTVDNLVFITGTAPVEVKFIRMNGADYPVTWTSATTFLVRVVVNSGLNAITVSGFDRFGTAVPGALASVNVTYTGPVVQPVGSLLITELMHSPTNGGQFIEIVNRSAQNFDLSGWRLDGINFQFGLGSIITNGQTILLAQNKGAFLAAYGNRPIFATFTASLMREGQLLALVRPTATGDEWIDGLRYRSDAPWPQGTNGLSLQLIDATQENSRPPNWAMGLPTPGETNSVAGTIQSFDPLWLNELQIANLYGFVDEFSEGDPWIELHNSGTVPVSLDGYFLATNFFSNLTEWPFPPGTTIAPGEHLLLWADGQPGQTSGTNFHTSFRLDFAGNLALVRLVTGQPQIVDYLSWSRVGAAHSTASPSIATPCTGPRPARPTSSRHRRCSSTNGWQGTPPASVTRRTWRRTTGLNCSTPASGR